MDFCTLIIMVTKIVLANLETHKLVMVSKEA